MEPPHSYLDKVHCVSLPYCLRLVITMLQLGGLMSSVLHVFMVALNHYTSIVYPLQHKRFVSGSMRRRVLCALWIVPSVLFIALSCAIPSQAFWSRNCHRVDFIAYVSYRAAVFAIIFLPMVLTLILYLRIVLLLIRQSHRSAFLTQNQPERQNRKG